MQKALLGIIVFFLCLFSILLMLFVGGFDGVDYMIRLDQQHGVIINNDTIQLNQLEEYIEQDNL